MVVLQDSVNTLACSYQAGFAILGLHDTLLGVCNADLLHSQQIICFSNAPSVYKQKDALYQRERGRLTQYNTETNTNTDTHHSTVTYVGLAENWRVGVGTGAVQAFIAIAT